MIVLVLAIIIAIIVYKGFKDQRNAKYAIKVVLIGAAIFIALGIFAALLSSALDYEATQIVGTVIGTNFILIVVIMFIVRLLM